MKSHLSADFRIEWGRSSPRIFVGPNSSPFLWLKVSLSSQQTIHTSPTDTKDPSDFDLGSIAARRGVCQVDDFGSSDLWKWSKWSATVAGRVESLNMIKWWGLRIFPAIDVGENCRMKWSHTMRWEKKVYIYIEYISHIERIFLSWNWFLSHRRRHWTVPMELLMSGFHSRLGSQDVSRRIDGGVWKLVRSVFWDLFQKTGNRWNNIQQYVC